MNKEKFLDIVDENDIIIGSRHRYDIHKEGLLHREIHVWFYTPNKEIIFQQRGPNTETFPNLLDVTVGGHVEQGSNYIQTALKETFEETGLSLSVDDLIPLKKIRKRNVDLVTATVNDAFKFQYGYLFKGSIQDLLPEEGKCLGFKAWAIPRLLYPSPQTKKKFIPDFFEEPFVSIIKDINTLSTS